MSVHDKFEIQEFEGSALSEPSNSWLWAITHAPGLSVPRKHGSELTAVRDSFRIIKDY